jgi:ABC-type branched-subunit amino acid transport system ATPase component
LLQVQGLKKLFGGLLAVRDLSFAVADGEILGLIGPNGSGKTTVFNLIAGALRPNAGRVTFSDRDITGAAPSQRVRLGIARTFQLIRSLPHLSTLDNVLVARLYGRGGATPIHAARSECLRLLETLDLAAKAAVPAVKLTLAERKRLEIARALATRPRIMLLDEPLGGLNAVEVKAALELLRQIRADGVTLAVVEHNVHAVRALCDRVIVLNSGQKIAEGFPHEVLARPDVIQIYLGRSSAAAAAGAPSTQGRASS